jgi:tetratricopeptide (TPR) repeat protein
MKIRIFAILALGLLALGACSSAADSQDSFRTAGALYSQSVDLANGGKYQEALDAADQALAMNESSLFGLIQSNRAGILVMLHRYDEAIPAADAAIAVEGNLTEVHSVAWYNKGNALRALGRIPEAQEAYDQAYALDNALVPPDMSHDVTTAGTQHPAGSPAETAPWSPAQKSPVSLPVVAGALGIVICMAAVFRKK